MNGIRDGHLFLALVNGNDVLGNELGGPRNDSMNLVILNDPAAGVDRPVAIGVPAERVEPHPLRRGPRATQRPASAVIR